MANSMVVRDLTLTFKQIAYGEFHGNVTFDLDFFGQGQM
jgi:hypothetical protein